MLKKCPRNMKKTPYAREKSMSKTFAIALSVPLHFFDVNKVFQLSLLCYLNPIAPRCLLSVYQYSVEFLLRLGVAPKF